MNETCTPVYNLTDKVRLQIGIAGLVSCCLSLLSCLFAIAVIVIYKKYVFSTQRLMLYLGISVMANVTGQMIQAILIITNRTNGIACEVAAFMCQSAAWSILISVTCISFELLIGIVFYKESGRRLNQFYFFAVFILPVLTNWIPLVFKAYGHAGYSCWILTSKNNCGNDKYIPGVVLAILLWWTPLYFTILSSACIYTMILCKLSFDKKKYTAMLELNRNEVYKKTLDDVMYLRYYPIIYLTINLIPFASDIYDIIEPLKPVHWLWIAKTVIRGLQGGFLTLVVTLDPKTRKRLTPKQLRTAFVYNVLMREVVEDYPIITGNISDSLHPGCDKAIASEPNTDYLSCAND